jgi:hypothetical protein
VTTRGLATVAPLLSGRDDLAEQNHIFSAAATMAAAAPLLTHGPFLLIKPETNADDIGDARFAAHARIISVPLHASFCSMLRRKPTDDLITQPYPEFDLVDARLFPDVPRLRGKADAVAELATAMRWSSPASMRAARRYVRRTATHPPQTDRARPARQ